MIKHSKDQINAFVEYIDKFHAYLAKKNPEKKLADKANEYIQIVNSVDGKSEQELGTDTQPLSERLSPSKINAFSWITDADYEGFFHTLEKSESGWKTSDEKKQCGIQPASLRFSIPSQIEGDPLKANVIFALQNPHVDFPPVKSTVAKDGTKHTEKYKKAIFHTLLDYLKFPELIDTSEGRVSKNPEYFNKHIVQRNVLAREMAETLREKDAGVLGYYSKQYFGPLIKHIAKREGIKKTDYEGLSEIFSSKDFKLSTLDLSPYGSASITDLFSGTTPAQLVEAPSSFYAAGIVLERILRTLAGVDLVEPIVLVRDSKKKYWTEAMKAVIAQAVKDEALPQQTTFTDFSPYIYNLGNSQGATISENHKNYRVDTEFSENGPITLDIEEVVSKLLGDR